MKKLLYTAIFKLDYIPKYGRVWRMEESGKLADLPNWRWQNQGMWGLCFLDRLDKLDEALDLVYGTDDINED